MFSLGSERMSGGQWEMRNFTGGHFAGIDIRDQE